MNNASSWRIPAYCLIMMSFVIASGSLDLRSITAGAFLVLGLILNEEANKK